MNLSTKYLKSNFLKNVLILITGASISQVLPLIAAPFLSRLYSPEFFGECGVLLSVSGIFAIIATFQYESAIMLPKKDKDTINLLTLCILITILVSALSFIICYTFSKEIGNILNSYSFEKWIGYVPLIVFLTGTFNALNVWAIKTKNYKGIALRQIMQSTSQVSIKIILGNLKLVNSGLVLGTISGQISSTSVLLFQTIKKHRALLKEISWARIKKNMFVYRSFPKYTMWQGFFDLMNESGFIFILSSFHGMGTVGWYSFTIALLQKPSQVIGSSVGQVFYQNASTKIANNESIFNQTRKLMINLILIGLIIYLPFLIFGKTIFSFLFGNKWIEAGLIAQIISPWLFSRFVASTMSNLAYIKNKQKAFFQFTLIINLLIPLSTYALSIFGLSLNNTLIIISILMVIIYIYMINWLLNLTKD